MLKATENWLAQVDYDLIAAENMLQTGSYIYVIFMCHLTLEKTLKALVTEETKTMPLRTHNLINLTQRAKIILSQEHQDFIGKINDASVVTRYPDGLSKLMSEYDKPIAQEYLKITKEIVLWIRQDPRLQI
jgi:HEPN domain-containing protein